MRITAELSLYPFSENFVPPIQAFIHQLRREPGLELVTNQMSTQLRGEAAAVFAAVARCFEAALAGPTPVVLVAKYLSADLPIATPPTV